MGAEPQDPAVEERPAKKQRIGTARVLAYVVVGFIALNFGFLPAIVALALIEGSRLTWKRLRRKPRT